MNWIYNRLITILIMIPLVSLYSFSLDLYIPLLPDIQEYFLTSKVNYQYSNSLFMLFCGVGQIIFGPISDNFGRKKTLLFSLIIFILANLICIFSNNVYVFILGRVFQAIGSCGAYLCCFATIRDIYINENESAEMFSYLNIANSISATIAPSLGTYISTYFPWQSIFVALTISSIFTFLYCITIYIETAPYTKNNKFNITNIIYNYKKVFFHINYQVYTLSAACGCLLYTSDAADE